MKRNRFIIATAGLLATIFFTGCSKDDAASGDETKTVRNRGALSRKEYNTKGYIRKLDICAPGPKTCLDIVIIRPRWLNEFDEAIAKGGGAVRDLFSDQETALALIPEFNDPDFEPVRSKILSGHYNFDKIRNAGTHLMHYVLGPEGNINHDDPAIVLEFSLSDDIE